MKIAIIGGGPTAADAPWKDRSWQFWGCNDLHETFRVIPDLWFEIHERRTPGLTEDELYKIKTVLSPVMMAKREADVPLSVQYPEALSRSGPMTCTFCYMLAMAVDQRPTAIGLWGVELTGSARELSVERSGLWYWIGVAQGQGIRVVGDTTAWAYPYRYGIDYWDEVGYARRTVDRLAQAIKRKHVDDIPAR